ncbi:hypothetical protein B0I37DRAFT_418495 [Chaetomium sp. MPI-CAGE-AT-0009]|nr:hypothetical protein B0I37DRAFT_418495 [Chaetomium sp. MPI-CAGE-AT-0009]
MEPDDTTLAPRIFLVLWSLVALSGTFIALKLIARARKRLRWWWDDWMLLLAWLCLGMAAMCLTKATFYGLGRHVQFLDDDQRSAVLGLGAVAAVLTIASSVWSKMSFALFLLRISSSGCTEWTRKALITIIISLNVMLPLALAGFFAGCSPVKKNWRPHVEGSCWPPRVKVVLATTVTLYSGLVDLVLSFLPWKIIWCLPFRKRDKVGLVALMSLGVFAAAASFTKCAYIHVVAADGDFSFDGWNLVLWSVLEPTLTIVAACIPVIRTFLRDLVRSFFHPSTVHRVEPKALQSLTTAGNRLAGSGPVPGSTTRETEEEVEIYLSALDAINNQDSGSDIGEQDIATCRRDDGV